MLHGGGYAKTFTGTTTRITAWMDMDTIPTPSFRHVHHNLVRENAKRRPLMSNSIPSVEKLVTSFEGLCHEKVESRHYDINERTWFDCWWKGHDWVNACLAWKWQTITCEGNDKYYQYVRLCSRCKLVDCFHNWNQETVFMVVVDEFYSNTLTVRHCSRCDRDIAYCSGCKETPDPRAWDIIMEIIKEFLPKPPAIVGVIEGTPDSSADAYNPIGVTGSTMMPSQHGFTLPGSYLPGGGWVSMPVTVSRILKQEGEEAAREYIKACLKDGNKAESYYTKQGATA
jgi:hypothetical protein